MSNDRQIQKSQDITPGVSKRFDEVMTELEKIFGNQRNRIAEGIARHLTPEQLLELAKLAIYQKQDILNCNPISIASAIVNAGQLGLTLHPQLKQVAIVPKKGVAQLWVMVAGWRELILRNQNIRWIDAHSIRENDTFDYSYGVGANHFLKFKPAIKDRSNVIIGAYALVEFVSGSPQFRVVDKEKLEQYRNSSDTKDSAYSPWKNWPDEMGEAKACKQLAKYLRAMTEDKALHVAVDLDDAIDANLPQGGTLVQPMPLEITGATIAERQREHAAAGLTDPDNEVPPDIVQKIKEAAHAVNVSQVNANSFIAKLSGNWPKLDEKAREKAVEDILSPWRERYKEIQQERKQASAAKKQAGEAPPKQEPPKPGKPGPPKAEPPKQSAPPASHVRNENPWVDVANNVKPEDYGAASQAVASQGDESMSAEEFTADDDDGFAEAQRLLGREPGDEDDYVVDDDIPF